MSQRQSTNWYRTATTTLRRAGAQLVYQLPGDGGNGADGGWIT